MSAGTIKTIWITGANGQVGSELRKLSADYPNYNFLFTTREEISIADTEAVEKFLFKHPIDVCINAAAYTAVDLAEREQDTAMQINGKAPGYLAAACYLHGVRFIHISTDYVFDGTGDTPYTEKDETNPVNYYGQTKLIGEETVLQFHPDAIIIRTSWVYSIYGKNFVKTMRRLMSERSEIGVVSDQYGCPTNAADLALALFVVAITEDAVPGIYHYCNKGVISWYDFATTIRDLSGYSCKINAISTKDFPTPAKRPAYSALDSQKIQQTFHLEIPNWKTSLEKCLQQMTAE